MAVLTVASKANPAAVLPAILTAAYAVSADPRRDVDVDYRDSESLGAQARLVELRTENGDTLANTAVTPYFAEAMGRASGIKLNATMTSFKIHEWLGRSADLTVTDFKSLEMPMKELESHLTLRSYIVGHSLTTADVGVWGALRGNKVFHGVRGKYVNVSRWFEFIQDSNPWITPAVEGLYATVRQRRTAASAAGGNYNIGLKNTENGIVTRFPPEPSGYLHIGHAKAALLNDYFAHEYAGANGSGVLICRFDDTNPSKESQEFQDSILQDLALLGVIPDRLSYSSDYFQQMYEGCLRLILEGKAYADDTNKEVMRDQRKDGIASVRRGLSVEDSLARFEDMKSGSEEGLRWCIRAKISVDDTNKALRDPVIYRCNLQPHHRTGVAWKIYPTYDFCAPFLDSFENVTHALRTNEYRDRNAQYYWVQDALGFQRVEIWDFSRLNFIKTVLSKRKLTQLVEQGVVWGWDDPRMPTVRGIRRRGMTIPALREFILKQGPSQNIVSLDWTTFWALNKKHIDPIAARHTAIPRQDAVIATVSGIDSAEPADKPRHAKNAALGTKKVVFGKQIVLGQSDAQTFQLNEEITLMNWGNAVVQNMTTSAETGKTVALDLALQLQGDVKSTEKKIMWLATEPQNLVPVELVSFDYLIAKDNIEKEDDLSMFLTEETEFRTEAWADCNVTALSENDIIQFDRTGYFRVDREFRDGQPGIFFNIPTGKQ